MLRFLVFSTILNLLILPDCYSQICNGQGVTVSGNAICDYQPWVDVFVDDFNGNNLDLTKWEVPYQGVIRDYLFQHSKQWYVNTGTTPSLPISNNIEVSNGTLKIYAKRQTVTGTYVTDWSANPPTQATSTFNYTSANIETPYLFGIGRFEIRCKIPSGDGYWPAFWTYGEAGGVNNEIDVFEFWHKSGTNNTHDWQTTMHYNGQHCGIEYSGPDYSTAFHTFTVEWTNHHMEWYIDGTLVRKSTRFYLINGQKVDCNGVHSGTSYIMDRSFPWDPQHIIVNMALCYGPDYINPSNANTPAIGALEVDYIKYSKKHYCSGPYVATSTSQLNLSSTNYNVKIGSQISIGGAVVLASNEQLHLLARDEIYLDAGFTIEPGSILTTEINPLICPGVSRPINPDSGGTVNVDEDQELLAFEVQDSIVRQIGEEFKSKINIYPNPTSGILTVDLHGLDLNTLSILIYDESGSLVYEALKVNEPLMNIDLTNFSKGSYYFNLFDKDRHLQYVNTVINK